MKSNSRTIPTLASVLLLLCCSRPGAVFQGVYELADTRDDSLLEVFGLARHTYITSQIHIAINSWSLSVFSSGVTLQYRLNQNLIEYGSRSFKVSDTGALSANLSPLGTGDTYEYMPAQIRIRLQQGDDGSYTLNDRWRLVKTASD